MQRVLLSITILCCITGSLSAADVPREARDVKIAAASQQDHVYESPADVQLIDYLKDYKKVKATQLAGILLTIPTVLIKLVMDYDPCSELKSISIPLLDECDGSHQTKDINSLKTFYLLEAIESGLLVTPCRIMKEGKLSRLRSPLPSRWGASVTKSISILKNIKSQQKLSVAIDMLSGLNDYDPDYAKFRNICKSSYDALNLIRYLLAHLNVESVRQNSAEFQQATNESTLFLAPGIALKHLATHIKIMYKQVKETSMQADFQKIRKRYRDDVTDFLTAYEKNHNSLSLLEQDSPTGMSPIFIRRKSQ